jgi:hypothetical protein
VTRSRHYSWYIRFSFFCVKEKEIEKEKERRGVEEGFKRTKV